MVQVLDVYWHFCESQDLFLGRILAGLDPSKASFGVLPPHFTVIDPLNDPDIKKAADMCFGRLMTQYAGEPNDPAPLLLRGLAAVIFHSQKLIDVCSNYPSHKFNMIPILHDKQLLQVLKLKVTLDPTPGVMMHVTGIPPHVDLAIQSKQIFDKCSAILSQVQAQTNAVVDAVKEAIDSKAWEQGHITGDRLAQMLEAFKDSIIREQQQQISALQLQVNGLTGHVEQPNAPSSPARSEGCVFTYRGKFWMVPENFKFPPRINLKNGLNFWFRGMSTGNDGLYIKPFRQLTGSGLPWPKLKNDLKLSWTGCFRVLESFGINTITPSNTERNIPQATIDAIYDEMVAHIRRRFQYCFTRSSDCIERWSIATWAVRMKHSEVTKHGTASDKSYLPEATAKNQSNNRNNTRKRKTSTMPLYLIRQERRQLRQNNNN